MHCVGGGAEAQRERIPGEVLTLAASAFERHEDSPQPFDAGGRDLNRP